MSVLVKKLKSTSIEAYVKGAPEVMVNICDKDSCMFHHYCNFIFLYLQDHNCITFISVPDDYNEMLDYYTRRGFRVIALAGKSIPNLTWVKAQRMKRYLFLFCLLYISFDFANIPYNIIENK